ncbi:hypothetical protein VTK26DRAFT_8826 [Humicola hyalothermophila]
MEDNTFDGHQVIRTQNTRDTAAATIPSSLTDKSNNDNTIRLRPQTSIRQQPCPPTLPMLHLPLAPHQPQTGASSASQPKCTFPPPAPPPTPPPYFPSCRPLLAHHHHYHPPPPPPPPPLHPTTPTSSLSSPKRPQPPPPSTSSSSPTSSPSPP